MSSELEVPAPRPKRNVRPKRKPKISLLSSNLQNRINDIHALANNKIELNKLVTSIDKIKNTCNDDNVADILLLSLLLSKPE